MRVIRNDITRTFVVVIAWLPCNFGGARYAPRQSRREEAIWLKSVG
jgi:hypothetical protein